MLQPQSSPEPHPDVTQATLIVFGIALFPTCITTGIYCLFHLGVL